MSCLYFFFWKYFFFLKDVNVKRQTMSVMYRSLGYPQEPVSCLDQLYERDRQLLESHAGQDFNGCELSLGFAINRNKYLSCENERLTDELNGLRMVAPMAQVRNSRQLASPRVQNSCVEDCFRNNRNLGDREDCILDRCDWFRCPACPSICRNAGNPRDCIEHCYDLCG
jgi:hypothetical protein